MAQRVTSVKEVFEAMAGKSLPEQAGDLEGTIQFDLSGEGGGQWYATITNRQVVVSQGVTANPRLTFNASGSDYLAIINGDLNPVNAFMQGKVRVQGDVALAMKLQSLFGNG